MIVGILAFIAGTLFGAAVVFGIVRGRPVTVNVAFPDWPDDVKEDEPKPLYPEERRYRAAKARGEIP